MMKIMPDKRTRATPFLIPNAITAGSLLCGLLVIFKMNMTEPGASDYSLLYSAALLLLIAAMADFADGFVARWMRAQTQFGLIFDSLNDAITFGVAPVVMVLKTLSPESKTIFSFWATSAAMTYCLCGVLRLVRYSTQKPILSPIQDRQRAFVGLPIPAACSALVSLTLFLNSACPQIIGLDAQRWQGLLLISAQFFLGFLMISRWRFPALSRLAIGLYPSFTQALGLALGASLLVFLSSHHFSLALVVIVWSYVLGVWLIDLYLLMTGSGDKALAARCDWTASSDRMNDV